MMIDRKGNTVNKSSGQDQVLKLLYRNAIGRMLLRPLVTPVVSKIAGKFLSSGLSRVFIQPFIRKNGIDMSQFESIPYRSYNEFFSRKIRSEMRPIDMNPQHFIAPSDSKLTVLSITPDCTFYLKHTEYTLAALLRDRELAKKYAGGYGLVFRLTVDDYHRYCYVDNGEKEENIHIPGVLHTVNPIANDHYPIYKENSREYSILHSETFGDILMMEVGALLVGKIVNHHGKTNVNRGQEKGYFQFGGSTVVLLIQPDKVIIDNDILSNSKNNIETIVRMGEKIGTAPKA